MIDQLSETPKSFLQAMLTQNPYVMYNHFVEFI